MDIVWTSARPSVSQMLAMSTKSWELQTDNRTRFLSDDQSRGATFVLSRTKTHLNR